ncbi:MAG: MBL fold metallo-hydrolase [Gammaproteobacteria bacterium]|nr:MBL fold metallo-hydrolase [Gammaproteobacteria bacterium]
MVHVDDHCILFDTGPYPNTVIHNAKVLGVDLSCVTDIVLSHFHFDHTSGLIPMIEHLRQQNDKAIRRVHVAAGFFSPCCAPASSAIRENQMIHARSMIEKSGVRFIILQ